MGAHEARVRRTGRPGPGDRGRDAGDTGEGSALGFVTDHRRAGHQRPARGDRVLHGPGLRAGEGGHGRGPGVGQGRAAHRGRAADRACGTRRRWPSSPTPCRRPPGTSTTCWPGRRRRRGGGRSRGGGGVRRRSRPVPQPARADEAQDIDVDGGAEGPAGEQCRKGQSGLAPGVGAGPRQAIERASGVPVGTPSSCDGAPCRPRAPGGAGEGPRGGGHGGNVPRQPRRARGPGHRRQAGRAGRRTTSSAGSARLAGTRRVGHAGTLDPMATGVLVVGIGRATRLLGHISAARQGLRGDDPAGLGDRHRRRPGAAHVGRARRRT